ncbi:discoidin domain-containing protein [Dysgonomonas massiliensis]|uniref:discoidin domain-containing protein n=1 Tax=Dysgonomonas massiliensis TaxID=2040292 RepID=UPI000C7906C0|nr:DUF4999 domain-containing protein [Dysgonomonas massiliensis]
MKKYWNGLAYIVIMIGIILGFSACSDDDNINKWGATYAYIVPQNLGILKANYILYHSDVDGISGDNVEYIFTVALNKISSKDEIIDLELDINDEALKEGISLSEKSVVIPAGSMASKPITLSVPDWSFLNNISSKKEYSIKINVKQGEKSDVLVGLQSQIELGIVKHAIPTYEVGVPDEGSLISNRSLWQIVIDPSAENANNTGRLVDGNGSTDIAKDNTGFWITVNLGQETTITGLSISSWGSSYAPAMIEVYTSDDGAEWVSQGPLSPSRTSTQNIRFIKPLKCQHIKYDILKAAPTNRTSITEFNVYAK